jgi:DHA1 family tetracycline resistance protein-like MFS transporter
MINGLAAMAGPALFGLTFAWSLRTEPPAPGAAIYVAAVLIAAAALIAVFAARAQARVTASSSASP